MQEHMILRKDPVIKKSFFLLMIGLLIMGAGIVWSSYILLANTHLYRSEVNDIIIKNICLLVLGIGFNGILYLYIFKKFITKLERISFTIDRVMDGDFSSILDYTKDKEGILSRLEFQFYQMGRRIKLNLENLNEEKEKIKALVADISHQIKTPLASIKMFNVMLQRKSNCFISC